MSYRTTLLTILMATAISASCEHLSAKFIATKEYPSLTRTPSVRLKFADSDVFGSDREHWKDIGFDPTKAASYNVTKKNGQRIQVRSIQFAHFADNGIPDPITHILDHRAGDPDLVTAYLELDATVRKGDSLTVEVLDNKGHPIPD